MFTLSLIRVTNLKIKYSDTIKVVKKKYCAWAPKIISARGIETYNAYLKFFFSKKFSINKKTRGVNITHGAQFGRPTHKDIANLPLNKYTIDPTKEPNSEILIFFKNRNINTDPRKK